MNNCEAAYELTENLGSVEADFSINLKMEPFRPQLPLLVTLLKF